MVALLGGLFVPATPAFALSGSHEGDLPADGSGSYTASTGEIGAGAGSGYSIPHQQTTTLEVDIISSPWATLDSNDPSGSGGEVPKVFVVEAAVRNTGDEPAIGLEVTLEYDDLANGWALLPGEDQLRTIDVLPSGGTYHAYWFASYPNTAFGAIHRYTVMAEADNTGQVTTSQNFYEPDPDWTVQTVEALSTGNSGAIQTSSEILVGVSFVISETYTLGSNPNRITFSPVGNPDFDPSAFRLLASRVRIFDVTQAEVLSATDRLYFSSLPSSASEAEITYTFIALTPANTQLCSYANVGFQTGGSGINYKYDQFYCSATHGTSVPITGTLTLDLTKQVSSQTIEQGEVLTYTIDYANNGDEPLQYTWVWDEVPTGVSIVSSSIDPSSDPDETTDTRVAWNLDSIQPGSSDTLTFSVLVDGNGQDLADGTSLVNNAFFGISPGGLPQRAALTSTVTTDVHAPTISITKTDGTDTAAPGDLLTYEVRVTNSGTNPATGVAITDVLPSDVTLAGSVTPSPDSVGQTLVWNDVTISPGNPFIATIPVRVASDAEDDTVLENTATVSYRNPAGHTYPDKTATDTTTVGIPSTELALTKTAEDLNGPPVGVGDAILYTLQVTNTGTFTAYNVVVTDDLPDLVTCQAVSGDSAPGGCADPLKWTIPSLAQGATASLYITVTIDEDALGESIINTASVIGDNVPNPPDPPTPVCPDGSTPDGVVCPSPSIPVPGTTLDLSKTAEDVDGPPLLVGDTIRYTLQVTNTGTYTAYNVIVTDDLPDQVTCRDVSGDSEPGGCADPLVWNIASLAPDVTASLYIDVTINRGSEGQSIINTASVIGGNVPNPPDPPTPVCPDGNPPVNGVCVVSPEPAPGSGIFLPLILKNSK
jgi:uncharacterized repeat protein (TIGR01451 family)